MVLVCHVISLKHEAKELCHFMGRSPSSRKVITLPSLVFIAIMVLER